MVPLLSCAGIILITASLVRRIFFYRLSEFDHLSKAEEAGINASLLLESAQKSLALEQRYHYVSQEASHKVLLDIRKLHSGFERKIKQITSLCENALNHLEKVRLVKGDLCETAPDFMTAHPETLFRIIHLSVNLYLPTRSVLQHFYPRLSRGGVLAIHGLNYSAPGAQKALTEVVEQQYGEKVELRTFEYYPNLVYAVRPS